MQTEGPLILIADDDPDDQELLKELLLQLDNSCTVGTVLSGWEVAEYLDTWEQDHLPYLIVLNFNIPGINGLVIFQYLRSNDRFRNIPVVFWSTSASLLLKTVCEEAGARWFVTKPTAVTDARFLAQRLLTLCMEQSANQ